MIARSAEARVLGVGFLLGVLLRSWLHMSRVNAHSIESSVFTAPALVIGAIVFALLLWRRRALMRWRPLTILCCAVLLGVVRFEQAIPAQVVLPTEPVSLSGTVAGAPIRSPHGITVVVHTLEGWNVEARATEAPPSIAPGSPVELFCRITPMFSRGTDPFTGPYRQVFRNEQRHLVGQCTSDSVEVIAAPSVFLRVSSLPERFRQNLMDSARKILPGPQATVLGSIVLGASRNLPTDIVEAFRKTGTLHILVVSGSHFSLLSGWMQSVLGIVPIGAVTRSLGIAGGLFMFLALIGFPAPAVRGWLAALSVLAAEIFQRPRSALHLLLLIASGMAFVDPWLPLFSLGFQLSIFATLGIISLTRPLSDLFASGDGGRLSMLREALCSTLAATIGTLPLLVGAFGTLSLVTVAANIVVVIIAPALLVLGLIFFGLTVFVPQVAALFAPLVSVAVTAFVEIVKSFADVPWANIAVGSIPGPVVAIECVVFIAICWRAAAPRLPFSQESATLHINS